LTKIRPEKRHASVDQGCYTECYFVTHILATHNLLSAHFSKKDVLEKDRFNIHPLLKTLCQESLWNSAYEQPQHPWVCPSPTYSPANSSVKVAVAGLFYPQLVTISTVTW